MPGDIKRLKFSDGVTVVAPTTTFFQSGSFAAYADTTAYETAKDGAAADGDSFYNTTTDEVWYYSNGAWSQFIDNDSSQTMTGKQLTTPQFNEAVNMTATSTELNQLDGVSIGGNSTGDVLTTDGIQTVTNKDLTGSGNTFNASGLTTGTVPDARISSSSVTQHEGDIDINSVSGTLGISKGGTGQTTAASGFDALAPSSVKGNLIAHNGTTNTVIAPSLPADDGKVLTVDSADSTGWSLSTPLVNPMNSDGDLIVGGASGAAARLDHPGAANYVLATTGASTTEWDDTPTVNAMTVVGDLTVNTNTLFVDASADTVGIGESTPLATLHVKDGDSGATVTGNTKLVVEHSGSTDISILSGTSGTGQLIFGDSDSNDIGKIAYLHSDNSMRFYSNGAERMIIEASGDIGINTNSPTAFLTVRADNSAGREGHIILTRQGGSATPSARIDYDSSDGFGVFTSCNGAGSPVLAMGGHVVDGDGAGIQTETATRLEFGVNTSLAGYVDTSLDWYRADNDSTWSTTSDQRVKENIRNVSDCLDKVYSLIPRHFNYVDTPDVLKTGFIAQEVEQILPGHVLEMEVPEKYSGLIPDGETLKGLSPEFLPYLVGAIKELKDKNDALEARIQALEP